MPKIEIEIPEDLNDFLNEVSKDGSVSRDEILCKALEHFIKHYSLYGFLTSILDSVKKREH